MTAIPKFPQKFSIEPLKQHCINVRKKNDQYYAFALTNNITQDLLSYIKFCLQRNEVIRLNVGGRVRSGKSLSMLVLCKIISQFTKVPFTIERNVLFNESEFLNAIQQATFHEIFMIDESEKMAVGYGAMAEQWSSADYRRICAKNCIHSISLVGDFSNINTNAFYKLVTLSRDLDNKVTRLLLYSIEDGENIPIGYVDIPIEPILCEDMKANKVIGCIKCPKHSQGCQEFLAQYERKKDTNIDKISGGKIEERALIRFEIAQQLSTLPEYTRCTNQRQRKIVVRKLAPELTNRRLTEAELGEIVEMTRMLAAEKEGSGRRGETEEGEESGDAAGLTLIDDGEEPDGEDDVPDEDEQTEEEAQPAEPEPALAEPMREERMERDLRQEGEPMLPKWMRHTGAKSQQPTPTDLSTEEEEPDQDAMLEDLKKRQTRGDGNA